MQILIIPIGFILWYFAYESKPINNDEVQMINDYIEFKFFKNIMNRNKSRIKEQCHTLLEKLEHFLIMGREAKEPSTTWKNLAIAYKEGKLKNKFVEFVMF